MLSSAFAYLNRTILHCFASSRRRLQTKGRKTEESGIKVRRTYPDDKRKRGWTHGRKEEKGNGRKATNKSDKEK
mgnify:FL=1